MRLRRVIAFVLLFTVLSVCEARADRPRASAEGIAGHAAFLDEEAVYMVGPGNDRDVFLTGNV